jgi:outer membrane murein-binding lipoprotein Lpp
MSVNYLPLLSLALGNLLLVGCVSKAEAYDDASGEVSSDDASSSVSADDIADLAASLAATQAELALLKSSVECFVGHMTDDQYVSSQGEERCGKDGYGDPTDDEIYLGDGGCLVINDEYGREWVQGSVGYSDAVYAYDDCF